MPSQSRRRLAAAIWVIGTLILLVFAATRSPVAQALPPDWERGANVTSWWHDTYEQPEALAQLSALRATGTTHVAVITTWYMDDRSSSAISPDTLKTPSDAGIVRLATFARGLGMNVILKPHVDVRDGTFRGEIAPTDPAQWFASYQAMIDHHADLAQQAGAKGLVIGTELTSMSIHAEDWRRLISGLRARFGGRLTFAANWTDGARKVTFWRDLDAIGIDAYMPLVRSDPNPSIDALADGWCRTDASGAVRSYVREVKALQELYAKPVIFTEIGYQSRTGTAATPWSATVGDVSTEAQRRAYEAAYRVWSRVPGFHGLYWWDWPASAADGAGPEASHRPDGKPAQSTMKEWNLDSRPIPPSDPCSEPKKAVKKSRHATVTSHIKLKPNRRGRPSMRISGRVVGGARSCRESVALVIERRRRSVWRRRAVVRTKLRPSRRYVRWIRRLPSGSYRTRSRAFGADCSAGHSRYRWFRIKPDRA